YKNDDWRYTLPPQSPDQDVLERWQTIPLDTPSTHTTQLALFLNSMDRGERPACGSNDVRRTLEFLAALYKSAITGQAVASGSITPDDPFYHAMNGKPVVHSRMD